jgi:PKD repeat protein
MKKMILCGLIIGIFLLIFVQGVQAAETYQFVTKWGSLGTGNGQFNNPTDLAVDNSGNVYVSDKGNNRIQKFASNGTYLGQWGGYGTGVGQFNSLGSIAVDGSGNVYVVDYGNNRTQKFNSVGLYLTQWQSSGHISVDTSGNVYIGTGNSHIQKFTSDGVFLTEFSNIFHISDLAVDGSGHIYVVDRDDFTIDKYTPDGAASGSFSVSWPSSIAVDNNGNVYVGIYSSPERNLLRIKKFTQNGTILAQWGEYGTGDGQLNSPSGIAIDLNGNVYVADTQNNCIQKFNHVIQPVANFTVDVTLGTAPMTVKFTDLSLNNPIGWAWFFGDENFTSPWMMMNTSAGWTGRLQHSSVAMPDGSIVLMGGIDSPGSKNDTWRSTDNGATWTQVNSSSGWTARFSHSSVAMPDGSIVLMGGDERGMGTWKNDVWRSTDNGATWTQVNASAGWTGRSFHTSVVMRDGSIVLMGGYALGGLKNDVWRSTDNGATWTQVNASAGWTGRSQASSVAMPDGSIVLMGGDDGSFSTSKNDVWRSTDNGATWTQITASAEWVGRYSHTSAAMPDGSIVLIGGFTPNGIMNDMWRSTDNGATWTQVNAGAGWTVRWGHTTAAMPDGSIVLMGGYGADETFKNDVWRFQSAGSSAQNPSHIYTAPGIYNIALQAYSTTGYNSTRKTGYITVTPPAQVASFTATPRSGTDLLAVQFNDTSTNTPTAWNWSFRNVTGNNTQVWFSTLQNPTKTFGVGNYAIVLNASNSTGYNLSTQTTFINVTKTPVNLTSTLGIYRNGAFYLRNSNTGGIADTTFGYGNLAGDVPLVGDWNGDRIDTIGVYRNGIFYLRNINTNGIADLAFTYGQSGDIPIVGDWTGSGIDTVGVYRNGVFYLRNSNTGGFADVVFSYGNPTGDIPVVGDWNGDGIDTVGVYRNGVFYLKNSNTYGIADLAFTYGQPGDVPVTGDWNGDGVDTIGVYRYGAFYLRNSNTGGIADTTFGYGQPGDVPVIGNWTGT